ICCLRRPKSIPKYAVEIVAIPTQHDLAPLLAQSGSTLRSWQLAVVPQILARGTANNRPIEAGNCLCHAQQSGPDSTRCKYHGVNCSSKRFGHFVIGTHGLASLISRLLSV